MIEQSTDQFKFDSKEKALWYIERSMREYTRYNSRCTAIKQNMELFLKVNMDLLPDVEKIRSKMKKEGILFPFDKEEA